MSVLIVYRSRYGAAARCARVLAERIRAESTLVDLGGQKRPDPSGFDVVIVGGSIYGGRIQREIPAFCERYRVALTGRPVGLFLCCLSEGEHAAQQMEAAFPPWLLAHAFARSLPGGELHYTALRPLDRLLVRSVSSTRHDVSRIRIDALERLADEANARVKGQEGIRP